VRKTSIQCSNPNCRARHIALLQTEAPPTAPLCVACETPLPSTAEGQFVYFAVSPSGSVSWMSCLVRPMSSAVARS
jgi:hypothetical protein